MAPPLRNVASRPLGPLIPSPWSGGAPIDRWPMMRTLDGGGGRSRYNFPTTTPDGGSTASPRWRRGSFSSRIRHEVFDLHIAKPVRPDRLAEAVLSLANRQAI